jgi:uncharacterized protein
MKNERGAHPSSSLSASPPDSPPASPRSSSHDADSPSEIHGVELSPDELSPDALRGLVEEFVSREGTDYGHVNRALEGKVAEVYRQLESGEARIVFDLESETASVVSARDLPPSRSR